MNANRSRVPLIITIVIAAILALLLVGAMAWVAHEQKKNRELTETLQVLQIEGIPEFMAKARNVMSGEILLDDPNDHLSFYSYDEKTYPTMSTVELDFEIVYAHIDGDSGEMWVRYSLQYFDSNGKTVMSSRLGTIKPVVWELGKRNGEWIITKTNEGV